MVMRFDIYKISKIYDLKKAQKCAFFIVRIKLARKMLYMIYEK